MVIEMTEIEDRLFKVIGELTAGRKREVLDFALFLQTQQIQRQPELNARPVQKLEELYGDFWPEDESVDDFIDAVQQWRRDDVELHRDLR
jgi:hypothetical protein